MKERDSRCSFEISQPCRCSPDAPRVGTPSYGPGRSHPDAGDLEALRLMTSWLRDGQPLTHLRFADGEFYTILGQRGQNGDGLRFDQGTFGAELGHMLTAISFGAWGGRVLVGGDWTIPEHEAYVRSSRLIELVPWCPSGIWVNGISSGLLAEFFDALRADPRPRILVANAGVRGAAAFLGARFVEVPASDAWAAVPSVVAQLGEAPAGAVVIYCSGMASEIMAWRSSRLRPDLSHLDMGHVFDGAFGIRSRCWLLPDGICRKRDVYFERYAPVIRGEKMSFGDF